MFQIKLRRITAEDILLFEKIYMDAEMLKFIGVILTKDQVYNVHKDSMALGEDTGVLKKNFVITLDDEGVGLVGISGVADDPSTGEIGVMVLTQWQKKNIAFMACEELIRKNALNFWFETLVAHVVKSNDAANSTLFNLGYSVQENVYVEKYGEFMNKWEWKI